MSDAGLAKKGRNVYETLESNYFTNKLRHSIPNNLDPRHLVALAVTLIKSSPLLAQCTPISLMACVISSAQLGLELDRMLGHAYLLPFKNAATRIYTATLVVGYRGFAHLMYQSGAVSSVSAEIVRPGDFFEVQFGSKRELKHIPKINNRAEDHHENWLGAYAVAHMITNRSEFDFMDRVHIEGSRARSQSWRAYKKDGRESPWNTDAEEMWRKTPIRRLAKRMPVSTTDKRGALLRDVMLDEYGERKNLLLPTESGLVVNPDYQPEANGSEEPLEPTLEAQLEESIKEVEQRKNTVPRKPDAA